jgi:hypothetical protein
MSELSIGDGERDSDKIWTEEEDSAGMVGILNGNDIFVGNLIGLKGIQELIVLNDLNSE